MARRKKRSADFFAREVREARRFYLDLGPVASGPLAVAAGGWEACAPSYVVERSEFPYFSVEFVVSGRGEVSLNGRMFPLVGGSVFAYGPGVVHRISSDGKDPLKKYFVDIRGHDAEKLMANSGVAAGACLGVRSTTRLAAQWEELLGFGTHPHALAKRGAVLSLELIMIVIAQEQIELSGTGGARATIDRCQAFMQENFLTVRSVEGVARACHLDVAYMCRLYRRFLDETPYRVLQRLQMAWAAEQLLNTGALVREVADRLELDPFQFSRTFKRVYGVSPTRFIELRSRS